MSLASRQITIFCMLTGISKIPLNYFLEWIKQDSTPTISILHTLSGCLFLSKQYSNTLQQWKQKLVGLANMVRVFVLFWLWSFLTQIIYSGYLLSSATINFLWLLKEWNDRLKSISIWNSTLSIYMTYAHKCRYILFFPLLREAKSMTVFFRNNFTSTSKFIFLMQE